MSMQTHIAESPWVVGYVWLVDFVDGVQVTDVLNSAQTGYVGGGTSSAAAGGDGYAA